MSRLSILFSAILAMTSVAAPARAPEDKPGTILMFGARWCTPCMVEYRDLPGLVAAAAPDHVVLGWIDRPVSPPSRVRGDVQSLPSGEARRLARDAVGDGYGLPISVLLDGAGHVCAIWHAPLHASDLAAFRAQCARSRPSVD